MNLKLNRQIGLKNLNSLGRTLAFAMGVGVCFSGWVTGQEAVSTNLGETTLQGVAPEAIDSLLEESQTLDSERIEQRNAEDFEDLFQDMLGIRAGGGRSQSQDVFLQGLQSTMANVTIDGAPQSGVIFYHAGSAGTIEPELLKAVTVSAGVSNALSGPGALGGSLSYETKDGFDLLEDGSVFGAQLKGTYYATADGGTKVSAMGYGLIGPKWSYLAVAGKSDVGNYEDGFGNEVIDTQYKRSNLLTKVSGYLTDEQLLSVSYEWIEDEGAGSARFNIYPDEASDLVNYKRRETLTLNYDYNPIGNDWVDLQTNVYLTTRELESSDEVVGIESTGFDIRNFSTAANGHLLVAYGVDYRQDAATSSNEPKDEKNSVRGFYGQADWKWNEVFSASAGARYDTYELDPRSGEGIEQSGFSPNATVFIEPIQDLKFHATYATAFRGVTGNMSKLTTATTSSDIDPEESQTVELGFEYELGSLFTSAKYFETNVDDLINPRPRGSDGRGNLGDLESKGYELLVGYKSKSLRLQLGVIDSDPTLTTVDGTVLDEYILVNKKTGRTWMGSAEYRFSELGLSLGWNVEHMEAVTVVGSRSTSDKDSTTVHNVFASWQSPFEKWDGLSVNLSVGNVFDKAYYDQTTFAYQSGYAAPGRDVRLSLKYVF